jgi:CubicO group peptidase (beta-lactamase class C family)
MHVFSALLAALGLAAGLAAQEIPVAHIDSVFAAWDRPGSPGCALGIVRDGQLVYTHGYGSANLDYELPNGPRMVYYAGSVSKQFTAAAVALLAEEGRISLDDDVRRWFPELPDYGRRITVRHLIHHTSGLRDIYVLMDLAGVRLEDVFSDEDAIALIARQKELNFLPGDDYLYSNSGYFLLAQLVERVTGESLRVYADNRIFRPLGMTDTHFHDRPGHIVKNRVISYMPDGDGFRVSYLGNFDKIGAGGLYTTIEDLLRWDRNFYTRTVGGATFLETIHTRGVRTDGDTLTYAFGLTLSERRGLRTVRHGGSMMGFKADVVRYPDVRVSILTLCNLGTIDPGALADSVADVILADRLRPVVAASTAGGGRGGRGGSGNAASAPAPRAEELTGTYHSDELDARYLIRLRDGALELVRPLGTARLRATAEDTFAAGNLTLRFERAAGRITGFRVEAGRVRNIRFRRIE